MRLRDRLPDTIATARLLLRAPRLSDLDDLVAEADNWNVLQPTATLPFPYKPEHGYGFITRVARSDGQRPYVIARAGDDRLIGVAGLYFHDGRPTELGYWLGESHWGQGFAPEAVIALLAAAAASGIVPIRARVLESNPASIRVLEKSGFTTIEQTESVVERHRGKSLRVMEWHP